MSITGRIVRNFSLSEMSNNDAKYDLVLLRLTPEVVEFAQMMQELRDWYNKPMHVNSWYRTTRFNRQCGGDSRSVHLDGRACDIALPNLTDSQWSHFCKKWSEICALHKKIGGINRYKWGIHFDDYEDKFGHTEFVIRKEV